MTSVELVRAAIARIERGDPLLRAFITLTADQAVSDAAEADALLARGVDRGPLHGIPVSVKDLFGVAGIPTTAGSVLFARNMATHDSAVTARLRAGGAVLMGTTNLHEWAFGVTSQNPHFGAAANPWDPTRIPGGSSGGSAIAVATGMCAVSVGSDTGGSIRIPAALCGVVGLKPTYGRVSLAGAVPLAWTLDHAGPLARTVAEAAAALGVLAGYDAEDPASVDAPADDYLARLDDGARGLRVLVPTSHFFDDIDPEVLRAVRTAIGVLANAGALVEERPLPHTDLLRATQRAIIAVEAATFHRERIADHASAFGADVLERLRAGGTITAVEHAQARRDRARIRRAWSEILRDHDVIATPTTPIAAPPRGGQDAVAAAAHLTTNTSPFNLTGLPAISIPCGFTGSGLPIGLQLAAGPWREALLLRAAHAYERATEWHTRHPQDR